MENFFCNKCRNRKLIEELQSISADRRYRACKECHARIKARVPSGEYDKRKVVVDGDVYQVVKQIAP